MTLGAETTTTDVLEGLDLAGRTAIVTGASAGLGFETARSLASAGASVTMAARTPAKLAEAAERIRSEVPDAKLETGNLDLASLESVRAFASIWSAGHDHLHLLINNAGVMFAPYDHTAEGFELHLGINYVGHFLLTNLLAPRLMADPAARVILLGSDAHVFSDILWDDPNFDKTTFDKMRAYGQSKTANLLFALELDRRLSPKGVHAYSVHPGVIMTELGRTMTDEDYKHMMEVVEASPSGKFPDFKTVEQGAATSVWAATTADLDSSGGAYLEDCGVSVPEAWGSDADSAARLWALGEHFVGQKFDY